jgi:hypothetical protein
MFQQLNNYNSWKAIYYKNSHRSLKETITSEDALLK